MIKKLMFTVALLAPCVAYGQSDNPSASFTDQVVQSGSDPIACDIGTPYTGSIPAAAAQAGFTHCAANYDFTQTQSFTDILGTHQWSNLSSWFNCVYPPPSPATFLLTFQPNTQNSNDVTCDTNHQNITTDGGVQVLALSYYLTDAQAAHYNNNPFTADFRGPPPGAIGTTFPEQSYVEQVFRLNNVNTCNSGGCLVWAPFYYAVNFNYQNPCFVEEDLDEVGSPAASNTNTAFGLWNPTCGTVGHEYGPQVPSQSPTYGTSYGTYGSLWTADNVSTFAACNYSASGVVSGLQASAFNSCVRFSVPSGEPALFTARQSLIFNEGPENSSGTTWTATSETTYIQRLTVWSCSGWQTGGCYNNPVITSGP
jgi:hypothetical protein